MNSPVTAAPTTLDVEHILVDVVFVLFYVTFGAYAIFRLRRPNRSSPECSDSVAMSRYFFYFLPFHCFARLQEIILRSVPLSTAPPGTVEHTFTIVFQQCFPAITFQIVLFMYLRVWQLQELELTPYKHEHPHRYQAEEDPGLDVRYSHVFLWLLVWATSLALDFALVKNGIEKNLYASFVVMNVNFIIIAVAFFYYGNKMNRALELPWDDAGDVGTFESHVLRIKWLFGVACLFRVASNVIIVFAFAVLQTNDVIFDVFLCTVEVIPLAASLLSMAIVERRMKAMHPSLVSGSAFSAVS